MAEDCKPKMCKCGQCSASFALEHDLAQHIKTKHSTPVKVFFLCSNCPKCFSNKPDVVEHMKQFHSHKCDQCAKTFPDLDQLKNHKKIHFKVAIQSQPITNIQYKCPHCPKYFSTFRNKAAFDEHNERFHNNKCDQCSDTFLSISDLACHKKVDHKKVIQPKSKLTKIYYCPYCSKVFDYKLSMNVHMIKVSGPFKCDMCRGIFLTNCVMDEHINRFHINTGCKFLPIKAKADETHIDSKAEEIQVDSNVCEMADVKIFKTEFSSHNDTLLQIGNVCSEAENQCETLTTSEGFICEICSTYMLSREALDDHLFMHVGIKKFVCQNCNLAFCYRENLKLHLQILPACS